MIIPIVWGTPDNGGDCSLIACQETFDKSDSIGYSKANN